MERLTFTEVIAGMDGPMSVRTLDGEIAWTLRTPLVTLQADGGVIACANCDSMDLSEGLFDANGHACCFTCALGIEQDYPECTVTLILNDMQVAAVNELKYA